MVEVMLYDLLELEDLGIDKKDKALNSFVELTRFLNNEQLATLAKLFYVQFDENGEPHLLGR